MIQRKNKQGADWQANEEAEGLTAAIVATVPLWVKCSELFSPRSMKCNLSERNTELVEPVELQRWQDDHVILIGFRRNTFLENFKNRVELSAEDWTWASAACSGGLLLSLRLSGSCSEPRLTPQNKAAWPLVIGLRRDSALLSFCLWFPAVSDCTVHLHVWLNSVSGVQYWIWLLAGSVRRR